MIITELLFLFLLVRHFCGWVRRRSFYRRTDDASLTQEGDGSGTQSPQGAEVDIDREVTTKRRIDAHLGIAGGVRAAWEEIGAYGGGS